MKNSTESKTEQNRSLSFIAALALVIGTMIGTGVFLKAAIMSQTVGSSYWVLVAWVVAGLLSLAGALTYAEIGALFPKAGGEYVYLKEGYGELICTPKSGQVKKASRDKTSVFYRGFSF